MSSYLFLVRPYSLVSRLEFYSVACPVCAIDFPLLHLEK